MAELKTQKNDASDRRRRAAVFGAAVVVSGVFLIDLCDAIFGCGCGPLWSGAAEACNIHHATAPHCPWCAHPGWGGTVAFFSVVLSQAAVVFSPMQMGIWSRAGLAVAAMPIVGGVVGLMQGLLFGYWS